MKAPFGGGKLLSVEGSKRLTEMRERQAVLGNDPQVVVDCIGKHLQHVGRLRNFGSGTGGVPADMYRVRMRSSGAFKALITKPA